MISNRVEMLVDMIVVDMDNRDKVFDTLVPKYHSELYVLYNILNNSNVLEVCELDLCNIVTDDDGDNDIIISVHLTKPERDSVISYVEGNDDIFKPFNNLEAVSLKFEKVQSGLQVKLN